MADLRSAFERLDDLTVPDLRDDIARRADREPVVRRTPPVGRRLVAGLVALAVFAGGAVLAWRAFGPQRRTPTPAAGTLYRDRAGWSIRIPPGWHALPFEIVDPSDPSIWYRGVQLSNVVLPVPRLVRGAVPQPGVVPFPGNGVAVIVARTSGRPGGDEVALPLRLDDFARQRRSPGLPANAVAYFPADGWTFAASVTIGADAAPDSTHRTVARALASFRPAPALGAPCAASQLTGRVAATEGAAGTQFVTIGLANASSTTCHLEGAPSVEALGPSGTPLPVEVRSGLPEGPALQPSTVTLGPGDEASLVVAFSDVTAGNLPCLNLAEIRIAVPGSSGSVEVVLPRGGQVCARVIWAAPPTASSGR
jgi:hypothetical protein